MVIIKTISEMGLQCCKIAVSQQTKSDPQSPNVRAPA